LNLGRLFPADTYSYLASGGDTRGLLYYLAVHHKYIFTFCNVHFVLDSTGLEAGCFPAESYAYLQSGDKVKMKDLRIGDQVLALDDTGRVVYSDVILMLDKQESDELAYYVLRTDNGHSLTLSADHLVFISKFSNSTMSAKQARYVSTGEYLYEWHINSQKFLPRQIQTITIETKMGAYAPLTLEGTIVIDGHLASSYPLSENHDEAHAVFAPWRWAYRFRTWLWGNEPYVPDQQGVHWSVLYPTRVVCSILRSDACNMALEGLSRMHESYQN
jgi:hypothetical protein